MMLQFGETIKGEEREYNLKCKIQVIEQSYIEIDDGRQHTAKAVLLLPDLEATETSRCLTTYLPDYSAVCLDCNNDNIRMDYIKCPKCDSTRLHREHVEVPAWIAAPVDSPSRLALLRKNNYCNQHHFFVMSTGVEEELKSLNGKTINIAVLPADQDAVADSAKSISRTAKG